MARETVPVRTEYVQEHEIYISDISGLEVPEDELVELHINPRRNNHRHKKYASDGAVHASVDEIAELVGINPDDIEAGADLPKFYVETAEPEVIEKSWVNLGMLPEEKPRMFIAIMWATVLSIYVPLFESWPLTAEYVPVRALLIFLFGFLPLLVAVVTTWVYLMDGEL